jgi:hypothetical protein
MHSCIDFDIERSAVLDDQQLNQIGEASAITLGGRLGRRFDLWLDTQRHNRSLALWSTSHRESYRSAERRQ